MSQDFDHLFRDKLRNHEVPPSAEAWAKLSGKLPKKDRKPFWFLGLGVLLGGIGVAYWYGQTNLPTENTFLNTENQKISEKQAIEKAKEVLEQRQAEKTEIAKPISVENSNSSKAIFKVQTLDNPIFKPKSEKGLEEKNQEKTSPISADTVSGTEAKKEPILVEKPSDETEKPNPEKETEIPITVIIKTGDQAANRHEPLQEADSLVKRKPRFLRILKQLHNFKEGEKVDFQELKRDKEE